MVDKIWQKLLTGVMAIHYANSPGYGTNLPLSWTDGSPNLPDKMDFWAFLCFSWKFCPFFFVLVSGPFLQLEHWPKIPHHLCRLFFFMKGELFEAMFLISFVLQGRIQDFFRRGCTRLFLYFNTNKPQFFFLQNTSCIRKLQVISGRGGAYPLHPPPRYAPVLNTLQFPLYYFVKK